MITTASFIKVFDLSFLVKYKGLLEHVFNIVSKSRSELEQKEELMRVSEMRKYDPSLMRKTYRDPRLFKFQGGEIKPEKVYSYTFEDNLSVYENRFIVFLIDLLSEEIDDSLALVDTRFFQTNFKGKVTFGRYGNYQLLQKYETDMIYGLDPDRNRLIKDLRNFSNRINHLKRSEFYRRVKPISEEEIKPTNLLIHDLDYSACFRHYLSKKTSEEESLSKILRRIYQERQDSDQIAYADCDIDNMTGNFTFTDHSFTFQFNLADKKLAITETNSATTVYYQLSARVNMFLPQLVLDSKRDHITLPISEDTRMSDVLSTLDFTLPFDEECPICHSELEEESGICSTCLAHYVIFERDGRRYIWIQNLSELEIGGDNYA